MLSPVLVQVREMVHVSSVVGRVMLCLLAVMVEHAVQQSNTLAANNEIELDLTVMTL